MDDLRHSIEVLEAALFQMRQDLNTLRRDQAISEEEVTRRLTWYAALEQLTIHVGTYFNTGNDTQLREAYEQVRAIHRLVSPATPPTLRIAKPA